MNDNLRHKGRLAQLGIYLGKFLRMFVYQNDWKVIPIGAVIAGAVTFVVGQNLFVTQEGTLMGAFALVCVCIWNGFFNSIPLVCREIRRQRPDCAVSEKDLRACLAAVNGIRVNPRTKLRDGDVVSFFPAAAGG